MKNLLISSLIALGISMQASAASTANIVEGDKDAGKAKAGSCFACHGEDGNSTAPNFPKLAGQNAKYLIKQMNDVKSGVRPIALMTGQLDNMSPQDIADIAAYFEALPASHGTTKKDLVELGEKIYRAGIPESGIAACTACHSPTGQGNGPAGFPMLSGQTAEYTATQLKNFRSGDRANDGEAKMMRTLAYRLKDHEIEAVASYIEGLH